MRMQAASAEVSPGRLPSASCATANDGPVWVVSGEPSLQRSTAYVLQRSGYDCLAVERAAAAVALSATSRPIALVVEERLPDASAFELILGGRPHTVKGVVNRSEVFEEYGLAAGIAFQDISLEAKTAVLEHLFK